MDYSLISAHLYHHLTEANYSTPPVKTDHKAFTLGIRLGKFKTGKGYPKVKKTLYSDPEFVEKVNTMIIQTLDTHTNHPAENIMDLILFNRSTIATEHVKETKDAQTRNINYLNLEITTTEAQLDSKLFQKPLTLQQHKHLNKLTNKLEALRNELKQTHQEIFNTTYLAELQADLLNPQKPSKEFKKPKSASSNSLSEMFIDQKEPPTLTKDQNKVHNHIFSFYNSLFAAEDTSSTLPDIQEFMKGIETEKITQEENERLQQPISKADIADFIKSMSNDKAPGLTGITPAFYKVFWLQIGDLVTSAVNNCLEDHSFPPKQKIGLVTLIPKQNKDTRHIENLRPITLLSTFYKIASGVLTNRLKPVFDTLINP